MATSDADNLIRGFASFLANSYGSWKATAEMTLNHDKGYLDESFDDWAQANWELLVERPLLGTQEYLEIYGSGSDYEMALHSRVFFHDAIATHRVALSVVGSDDLLDVLNDRRIGLADFHFERFVAMKDGFYHDVPPFDHVLLLHNERNFDDAAVIHQNQFRFDVKRIKLAEQVSGGNGG
jgi:hypothetical protein